jgi:hypothetical protein
MKEKAHSDRITDRWLVDEVLLRYPSTSVIFLQHGVSPGIRAVKRKSQHAAAGMDCGATE